MEVPDADAAGSVTQDEITLMVGVMPHTHRIVCPSLMLLTV